jgi:uncharacterized protein YcbK (DUF882 family)
MMNIANTLHMTHKQMRAWRQRWPNFAPAELDSDDWSLLIDELALDALQRVRTRIGHPVRITCAYRNPWHNKRVGGSQHSQHLKGLAFDIAVTSKTRAQLIEKLAIEEGFTAIGRYPKRHFIHIDMRPAKASGRLYRWGQKW